MNAKKGCQEVLEKITSTAGWSEAVTGIDRHRELIEESNHRRLVRRVSERGMATYRRLLSRLGRQLVRWGFRLQVKYGAVTETSQGVCHLA